MLFDAFWRRRRPRERQDAAAMQRAEALSVAA
jgi:hypothetical protein